MKLLKGLLGLLLVFSASNSVAEEHYLISSTPDYALSSADYRGNADASGSQWSGELSAEVLSDRQVEIPVLPASGVLVSLIVDGKPAPVFSRDGNFVALIQGKGIHKISTRFNAPVEEQGGLATIKLGTIPIPVSHFEITLAGQQELRVTPGAAIERSVKEGKTLVSVNVPMTSEVAFSWSNVLPDGKGAEAKLHATLYHFALPDEGVLSMRTIAEYEILRGEVSSAQLEIPAGFEVTRVQSPDHTITDWRVSREQGQTLYVTFQEPIKSDFTIDCTVERSLPKIGAADAKMALAPLRAKDVVRQKGIIALLGGKDVALSPLEEHGVMQVGENQIPANIRGLEDKAVLHTFKYLEDGASLMVAPTVPEHKAGRFDALVNTLFSLGDVSVHGSAKVHVQVKAGSISDLTFDIPKGVSVLSLVAPSMRNFNVDAAPGNQHVRVQFTQEMEGSFPIDVQFERLLAANESTPELPTLHVENAEVEEGKFAVEALSAVEVQAGTVNEYSPLELTAVPQEILLQTTNPLLLAFNYPRFNDKASLSLKVTRHQEVETQAAVIDEARYETLATTEGLAVTSARYMVRNTKSQFLRLSLPEGSSIWSLTVQGEDVKPAKAEHGGKAEILVKIINSRTAFPVELTYGTPIGRLGFAGTLRLELPKVDLITTRTAWSLYMPEDFKYGIPHTDFTVDSVESANGIAQYGKMTAAMQNQTAAPFAISIPANGLRYSFSKVFASDLDNGGSVGFAYLSNAFSLPRAMATLAAALLGFLVAGRYARARRWSKMIERISGGAALTLLAFLIGYFHVGIGSALLVAIATAAWIAYPNIKALADGRKARNAATI